VTVEDAPERRTVTGDAQRPVGAVPRGVFHVSYCPQPAHRFRSPSHTVWVGGPVPGVGGAHSPENGLDGAMVEVTTRAARSTAQWTVPAPLDAVRARLIGEVERSSRARLTSNTDDELQVSVQGNAFSWGEVITVTMTPVTGGTSVAVETRPTMGLTLFDWGEGARDIRLLHAAVPGIGSGPDEQPEGGPARARLGSTSRLSRPVGWFVVAVACAFIAVALFEMVVDSAHMVAWLPMLALMMVALVVVVRDLQKR